MEMTYLRKFEPFRNKNIFYNYRRISKLVIPSLVERASMSSIATFRVPKVANEPNVSSSGHHMVGNRY